MGTAAFAVPALKALSAAGHRIAAVYTRAPRPAGRRGLELVPSPVHTAAQGLGLAVMTPKTLRGPDAVAKLEGFAPDGIVAAAYGLILPNAILEMPERGCLNLHASLLPRWRGAAPIERAIMAGDKETGVVVMRIVEGLDEGPAALCRKIAIGPQANAGEIRDELAKLGAGLIVQAVAALERGELIFTPQAEAGVTYAPKISKEELRIDWRRPAAEVHNLVRGLAPAPGAYFEAGPGKDSERIKLLRSGIAQEEGPPGLILDARPTVACGTGSVRLLEVQRPGKRPMPAQEFWRGARIGEGTKLPLPGDAAL
ncbi:MAG: methionyl-tRNA formyltransferase [Methylocapsa sp.]|nr:methionyl-tRNA formyltransferase [Methylocapsa sp.]